MAGRVVARERLLAAFAHQDDAVGALGERGPCGLQRRAREHTARPRFATAAAGVRCGPPRRDSSPAECAHPPSRRGWWCPLRRRARPRSQGTAFRRRAVRYRTPRRRAAGKLNRGHAPACMARPVTVLPNTRLPPICCTRLAQVCATSVPCTWPSLSLYAAAFHRPWSEAGLQAQHLRFVDHPCDVAPRLQPGNLARQRVGVLVGGSPGKPGRPNANRCRRPAGAQSGPRCRGRAGSARRSGAAPCRNC